MQQLELLERAISHAGSAYKLARILGVSDGRVGDWRNQRKPIPLETIADLAASLEVDVGQAVTDALLEQTKGTARGERIARAVGKTLKVVRGATAAILLGLVAAASGVGVAGNDAAKGLLSRLRNRGNV